MFLELAHQNLDVYKTTRQFVLACYKITKLFPVDERFNMVQQIRRAALSTHLNIAEGCSRKSEPERIRYFEISRGSIIEIDAALDIAVDLEYVKKEDLGQCGNFMIRSFKMLTKMINHKM